LFLLPPVLLSDSPLGLELLIPCTFQGADNESVRWFDGGYWLHERAFDVHHALVDGHWTDGTAALVMAPARIDVHALVATAVDARVSRHDRAASTHASRDPGERVSRGWTADRRPRTSRGEPLLHREPELGGLELER
jgi:hypothetical protein